MVRTLHLAFVALLVLGCVRPDPAPTELDELLHYFFVEYDTEDSGRMAEAVGNTVAWFQDQTGSEGSAGTVSKLRPNEVTVVGMAEGLDMRSLVGVYELIHQSCTVEELERIYLEPDQLSLFPGNYDEYTRDFTGGLDCYTDGSCSEVTWDTQIVDSMLGKTMTYGMSSGLLRVAGDAPSGESWQAVLSRTWLVEPAVIGQGEGSAFYDQGYQIEAFIPHEGRALHLYAIWNSGGLDGVDPDAALWPSTYLDGLQDWDKRLDAICDEGLVP